ncbi:ABC transporter permease [Cellulomonas hominis]|uniref:Transport permease protein n=1 Tax=Cellulomonas hominis TaxID=156981 RepID=A0A511F7E2_9CELL|nr:ABC transporter permease [Cellulomonas hominis]MBB5474006.1 ABC-2 type transport system permease protein [Cellulomonas hominis]MBU5424027.1 ABC transporter permease [Cellulomonas hominis]NKY07050.1 ABC transporter permease [Cellulomonas hominis]GEL45199.1 transport permease protein [Cellulomonas hominis]
MSTTSTERFAELEQEPMRLAGPRPGFFRGTLSSIREIADHRELLGLLVRRELKAKYKDSVLGFFWSLMRPLAMLLVYYIALGKFLEAERQIPSFAIFVFTGLTAWGLFSEIITTGTASVVANSGLVKKVYLPREIFPLSVVGSSLVNFVIQLGILTVATVVAGEFPTGSRWLYLPLSLAVLLVYATASALVLAAANVYLRDVQYLVEIAIMVMMWASPIVYSWALVEGRIGGTILGDLYLANPITLVVIGFQRTFWVAGSTQTELPHLAGMLGIALAVGLLLLWIAQRLFGRLQSNFAQEL